MSDLKFNVLRGANILRLPLFMSSHGKPAHLKEDGSDWSPAQWLCATMGELGEFAEKRLAFERGEIDLSQMREQGGKELADFFTYGDILARRCLDVVRDDTGSRSHAQVVMQIIACLGLYCNVRKKYERGDYSWSEYAHAYVMFQRELQGLLLALNHLQRHPTQYDADQVTSAHGWGVNLGVVIAQKFNEVSERVKAPIFIRDGKVVDERPKRYLVTRYVEESELTSEERKEFNLPWVEFVQEK